jgi:MFS family permease
VPFHRLATLPIRFLAAFVSSFHPHSLPPMLRRNYGRELAAWAFLPLMLGGIQSGAMGVVLKKTFVGIPELPDQTLDIAVAAIAAATAIGNLTSGIWATIANGRRKVAFLSGLMLATSACVATMAFIPRTAFGAWSLVALVILGWVFWSAVVTIRTSVWRANYPDADRTKITGRIATVQVLVMAASGVVIGWSLDRSVESIRYLFPMMAVFGVVGAIIYGGVRLRGQNRLARAERQGHHSERPSLNPFAVLRVLRDDRRYAGYMACMMLFGTGNLMISPTLVIILEDEFIASYQTAILVTTVVPLVIMPFAIPIWARLLDQMHVISFRAIHSWAFVLASLLFLIAVEYHLLPLLFIASAMLGIGFGGGMLAWNLGHQHFAPPHRDSQYMSVHVMLTGLRGLFAPFLGVAIYTAFAANGHPGLIYAVTLGLNIAGALGFLLLRARHNASRTANQPTNRPSV